MEEKFYMSKTEFAATLNISLSTLERREKEMNYFLPSGALCPDTRATFMAKLREWEAMRLEERQRQKGG